MQLSTFKYADVSTCHITAADAALLDADAKSETGLVCCKYEEGYWVCTAQTACSENEELAKYGYSRALLDILKEADRQGCNFVRFDADGNEIEGAPTFDW